MAVETGRTRPVSTFEFLSKPRSVSIMIHDPKLTTDLMFASSLLIRFSSNSLALALRMSAINDTSPLYWLVAGFLSPLSLEVPRQLETAPLIAADIVTRREGALRRRV